MYTFTTKNFEIRVARRMSNPGKATLDSEVVDDILEAEIAQIGRLEEASRKAALDARMDMLREHQARFFATFQRAVPDDAVEHPLEFLDDTDRQMLFSGDYGYLMFRTVGSSRMSEDWVWGGSRQITRGVSCDEALVAPWLTDLLREFGSEMVFNAAKGLAQHAPGIDAVCRKYDLPLSVVRFSRAEKQNEMFAFRMHVDGATVPLYTGHRGPIEHPERLTPWARALFNHPKEQAILLEIAHVLNSE